MFNIAHLADLHLGYSSGRKKISEGGYNVRENDGYIAFNTAINQIIDEKPDVVVIPGDVFHSPRPKNHTILIAQEGLRRLTENNIKVYIVAGNHDATDVRAEVPSSKLLHEPGIGIYSYDEPYIVKEVHPGVFMHFIAHHAFLEQENTMSQIKLEEDAVNLLITHGSCYDTNIGCVLRTPNEPREVVIPQEIMELPWDYTLLGHIHERGWIGSKDKRTDTAKRKQFYNGSLIRRGFSDKPSKLGRGWTKWTINDDKSIKHKFFTIKEREQIDLEPIDVIDKKTKEIEDEIINQLITVDEFMSKKYEEITIENAPIVRQTLIGVSAITRLSLNLQRFNEYTDKYLSHSFKVVPMATEEETEDKVSIKTLESFKDSDIVLVFKEWNKNIDKKSTFEDNLKAKISEIAENNLKICRDEMLTRD